MKRLQRAAVVTALVERMREHDSWCGETHVHKATYIAQELLRIDLGYPFVLYKHGPFSFDLRAELGSFAADRLIRYQPQAPPYGPRIAVTEQGESVQALYSSTVARYADQLDFVAEKLDARGVVDLERLATALYVTRQAPDAGPEERAMMLRLYKPHVPEPAAMRAVEELDNIRAEVEALAA